MDAINYLNLIRIAKAVFEKIVILDFGAQLKGPSILELECSDSSGIDL
jgi:hypothetical protein